MKLSHVLSVPGELLELQAANKKLNISKQDMYSELLYYARQRGFKDGWAAHKYKEKFGVFPKGLQTTVKEPTTATLGWIKSRAIAFAKSRANK